MEKYNNAQARTRTHARVSEFAVRINAIKREIPKQNWRKFDIEAEDTIKQYAYACKVGDRVQSAWLERRWEKRVEFMWDPRNCSAPPMLIQLPGESNYHWLNRCYLVWRKRG